MPFLDVYALCRVASWLQRHSNSQHTHPAPYLALWYGVPGELRVGRVTCCTSGGVKEGMGRVQQDSGCVPHMQCGQTLPDVRCDNKHDGRTW